MGKRLDYRKCRKIDATEDRYIPRTLTENGRHIRPEAKSDLNARAAAAMKEWSAGLPIGKRMSIPSPNLITTAQAETNKKPRFM